MGAGIGPCADLGIEDQEQVAFRQQRDTRNGQVAGDGYAGEEADGGRHQYEGDCFPDFAHES